MITMQCVRIPERTRKRKECIQTEKIDLPLSPPIHITIVTWGIVRGGNILV